MNEINVAWIVGILLINGISLVVMGIDKRRAKKGKWRIPEKHLWMLTFFGGSVGIWIGMNMFRHKTKHTSFKIGVPACFVIQIVLVLLIFMRL